MTDIFGGQVAADLIYDPSSSIFSTLRTKFNFYYGEKKYRLFECMVRIKGKANTSKFASRKVLIL